MTDAPPTTAARPALFRVSDRVGYHDEGIPWAMIAPHEDQAQRNHGQSLARLHARGGLSWCEALAILERREWQRKSYAKAKVLELVETWKAAQ